MENIENIENIQNTINETVAGDIAGTDSNLTVDGMFQQSSVESLARRICSVSKLSVPSGGLFNLRKKSGTNDFELVRRNIEVYPSEPVKTGITNEVIEDIKNVYSKDYVNIIGKLFKGIANDMENEKLLEFLDANAKDAGGLTLTDSGNAELNLFETTQKVHEIILKMNQDVFITYESFVVLPAAPLAGIMALSQVFGGAADKDQRGLFITRLGQTNYYLNPDPTSTTAYVGLVDKENPGRSSITFLPYQSQILDAIDPETGNTAYFLFNRFGIAASPLHETNKEMLFKFNITI